MGAILGRCGFRVESGGRFQVPLFRLPAIPIDCRMVPLWDGKRAASILPFKSLGFSPIDIADHLTRTVVAGTCMSGRAIGSRCGFRGFHLSGEGMQAFRDLPVARKFMYAFGLVCALCAVLGAMALVGMARMNRSTTNLAEIALPSAQAITNMESAMQVYRRADMGLLLCDSGRCVQGYVERRQTAVTKFKDAADTYTAAAAGRAEHTFVESASGQFTHYQQMSDATVAALQGGRKDEAAAATVGEDAQVFRRAEAAMNQAAEGTTQSSRQLCLDAAATYRWMRTLVFVVIALTILLSALIGRLLTASIAPPLIRAAGVLEAVAAKDLTQEVLANSRDEIGRMTSSVSTAVATMRRLLQAMQGGIETLSAAASELSSQAANSADNARQQAKETSQIASASQQMASTVAEVSENAERACAASSEAARAASEGGAVIERTAGRMRSISASNEQTVVRMSSLAKRTEQIGNVVTTIKEISEQTNLLALNANIEAQRAGEHGRGFAVVAGEVRRLAERTRSATEEISNTIAAIQKETHETLRGMDEGRCGVAAGLEDSETALRMLNSIISLNRRSEEQIALIATAAMEQAAASKEISQSLSGISDVSSHVNAAAHETTEASENLSRLAADLNSEINGFRLAAADDSSPRSRVAVHTASSDRKRQAFHAAAKLSIALVLAGGIPALGPLAAHAEEPVAVKTPADPSSPPPDHPSPSPAAAHEELQLQLDSARRILREQAHTIRLMQAEIARQGRELQLLVPPLVASTTGSTASDPAADAELLRSAAAKLGGDVPVTARLLAAQKDHPLQPPSDLYFRIGNATFTPSGWIDFTSYFRTTNVGSGLGTAFQSIPFSNTVQGGESEVRLTAQSSRIGMRVDEAIGTVKAYGYLEADFNGYQPGNAYVSTNSNSLRMRVYYMNLAAGRWELLGGQGWSLLTPTRKALSPFLADLFTTFHLDTSYQAGLIFARQTQLRAVYHPAASIAMGLSIEEPQQYSGSAVTFPALFSTSETDINSSSGSGGATAAPNLHPDLISKVTFDRKIHGLYWHLGAAGLLTAIRVYTPATVTKSISHTDSREGGAGAANLFIELFKGFHLVGLAYWSDGGGRYMGGIGPGFVALQSGAVTSPFSAALLHSGSAIGGFEWTLTRRLTVSAYSSGAYFQRRFALDPSVKTPTYVGYGYPGSANTNNRLIEEASLATTSTLWQNPARGSLQVITQTSFVKRAPWFVSPGSPKNAHTVMEYANLRYVLP